MKRVLLLAILMAGPAHATDIPSSYRTIHMRVLDCVLATDLPPHPQLADYQITLSETKSCLKELEQGSAEFMDELDREWEAVTEADKG
jgi:hypothetical protein